MGTLFRRLRLRLTLLYLFSALAFILLLSVGSYRLLSAYFQRTVDQGLQHKMAHEFRLFGAPVPMELVSADQDRYANSVADNTLDIYDPASADIFVLPLNRDGELLFNPNPYTPPFAPDPDAVKMALAQGTDWRTTRMDDGTHVRLLTYRLTRADGPAVLQLGRDLSNQERVLHRLLFILLSLGSISAIMLGFASWWLSGRSLVPTQQAWERQQAFISNASHELRTPLALIRASSESIQRRLPVEETRQQRLLRDVIDECDHMTRLVNDMLLLSRLDTGQLEIEHVAIALPDLLYDLQRQMGELAQICQVTLTVSVEDLAVWGDPARLRQVLLIVLDNALQHTPSAGLIHMATHMATHAARPSVHISVSDTGCGIAPEHLPHVFERFYRADTTRTHQAGMSSTGLGLSIARVLVEAQHGTIEITSQVGQGTCVTLTLPMASIEEAHSRELPNIEQVRI